MIDLQTNYSANLFEELTGLSGHWYVSWEDANSKVFVLDFPTYAEAKATTDLLISTGRRRPQYPVSNADDAIMLHRHVVRQRENSNKKKVLGE